MATVYVRRVNLKDSLSDAEVAEHWRFVMQEVLPAIENLSGVRSAKAYSGAGGLRADLRYVIEMDDAGVYERMLAEPQLGPLVAKTYAAWDMSTASQQFVREITPELIQAIGGGG